MKSEFGNYYVSGRTSETVFDVMEQVSNTQSRCVQNGLTYEEAKAFVKARVDTGLHEHFARLARLYQGSDIKPEAVALTAAQFDELCGIVAQHQTLTVVADSASRLSPHVNTNGTPVARQLFLDRLNDALAAYAAVRSPKS